MPWNKKGLFSGSSSLVDGSCEFAIMRCAWKVQMRSIEVEEINKVLNSSSRDVGSKTSKYRGMTWC